MIRVEDDLRSIGKALVERLGGRWDHRGGLCRCPAHDDSRPSLSVRVGNYGLLYHCFAGCDVADVLREVRRVDRRAMATRALRPDEPVSHPSPLRDRILALWAEAVPVARSPGALYLRSRGLAGMGDGLRFHARTPLGGGRSVTFRPAILGAVQKGRSLLALHRTFLTADGSGLADDIDPPRRMLGRPLHGAVRLGFAASTLAIAEGIETALSAMRLLGIPVWAALGNERLPHLDIPLGVRRLIILADDDLAGRRSAAAAAEAHALAGRSVIRLWPGRGHNDWNDRLRAGGEGVGMRVRQAA